MANYVEPTTQYLARKEREAQEFLGSQANNAEARKEYLAKLEADKAKTRALREKEEKDQREKAAAGFKAQKRAAFLGTDVEFEKVWPAMLAQESERRDAEASARARAKYSF